jgi:rhomboid protease GluP
MSVVYRPRFNAPQTTKTLITLCVGVYVLLEVFRLLGAGDLSDMIFGYLHYNAVGIYYGQFWRLFTASLLHGGLLHLILNMISLLYLGGAVERIFGSPRMIAVWLFADAFGGLFTYAFSDILYSVGASGAIFGLAGAMLALYFINRPLYQRYAGRDLWLVVLINFIYGITANFMQGNINVYAHIGGFLGGAVMALAIGLPGDFKRKKFLRVAGLIGGFILLIAMWFIGTLGLFR